ncbi:hypothetical protein SAMD00079811_48770 [Scytonema sp. HK-05]|nr:hypothetical protein SAMD00079811_48770 [Scytonema sp. HK-05]
MHYVRAKRTLRVHKPWIDVEFQDMSNVVQLMKLLTSKCVH